MNEPAYVQSQQLESDESAYEELSERNYSPKCEARIDVDVDAGDRMNIVDILERKYFIDNDFVQRLKHAIDGERCQELDYVQSNMSIVCKTFSYATLEMGTSGKQYTAAYSCCEFRYQKLPQMQFDMKKIDALRYEMYLVKKNMIETIGSTIQDLIKKDREATSTESPLNADDFTISI